MKGQLTIEAANAQNKAQELRLDSFDAGTKDSCVSDAFRYLLREHPIQIRELAKATGISENTLYTINGRNSDRANMAVLKKIADYFQVDVSIFCGYKSYKQPKRLSEDESNLLEIYGGLTEAAKKRVTELIMDVYENPKNRC